MIKAKSGHSRRQLAVVNKCGRIFFYEKKFLKIFFTKKVLENALDHFCRHSRSRLRPGVDAIKLFLSVIYEFSLQASVFVPGKIFQPSLTNTSLLQKSRNLGTKKFYNIGPRCRFFLSLTLRTNKPYSLSMARLFSLVECFQVRSGAFQGHELAFCQVTKKKVV